MACGVAPRPPPVSVPLASSYFKTRRPIKRATLTLGKMDERFAITNVPAKPEVKSRVGNAELGNCIQKIVCRISNPACLVRSFQKPTLECILEISRFLEP